MNGLFNYKLSVLAASLQAVFYRIENGESASLPFTHYPDDEE